MRSITVLSILFAVVALVVGILYVSYNYKDAFDLQFQLKNAKAKILGKKVLYVRFSLNASIDRDCLSINYYVPCSTMEQRTHIVKNLPVIKHGLLMDMNRPKVMTAMQKRDFESIKKYSLKVINGNSIKDVDKIYLDSFSLQGKNY